MQTLNQFQGIFEQYLSQNRFNGSPATLYEPANYILSIGGKRLRPAMLMLGYYLFDDDVEKALPAALAVEVFHNFSLVHDDIMDAAPLRRGQQTVHAKYGVNTGILSGDVMLVGAYDCLLRLENKAMLPEVMKVFTRMAIEVCEGQQMDMDFETEQDVSIADYLRMIESKTAVLVAAALKIGAILSNTSRQNAEHLYEFGRNLGIAFQLQDDLLDTFGDPKKVGKKTGGDIAQNKKTFLYLKAIELADAPAASLLRQYYTDSNSDEKAKVEAVTNIFETLGIRQATETIQEAYRQKAWDELGKVEARGDRRKLLEAFAEQLMQRDF